MNFIVDMPPTPNEYLTEEKMEGGAGADARGNISENTFHIAAKEYIKKKKELLSKGKGDDDAHHGAITHLRSDKGMEKIKKSVDETNTKKIDKDDLNHTIEDCTHATADWLHHIHQHTGSIDTEQDVHLTGPIGEKNVADEVGGFTNADLIIGVKRRKTNKNALLSLNLRSNDGEQYGNSLKYATKPSNSVKIRTPGGHVFHRMIQNAASSIYSRLKNISQTDPDHEKRKSAQTSYERLESPTGNAGASVRHDKSFKAMKEKRLDFNNNWRKGYSGKIEEIDSLLKGKKLSFLDTISTLRKIKRGEVPGNSKMAEEHVDKLNEHRNNTFDKLSDEHSNNTTNLLNNLYDAAHSFNDSKIHSHINRLHRIMTGTFARRRKFVEMKGRKVPVIPTNLVVVQRTKRGERPNTKIYSPTNRLEELSRSSEKWMARTSEGRKGLSIDRGRGLLQISHDPGKDNYNIKLDLKRKNT
jgi:hypothetical protein